MAGRYRLETTLAKGGMGTVYRAFDLSAQRPVALKRILERLRSRPVFTALFQQEYHTLAQLRHPRIIELFYYAVDANGPYSLARGVGIGAKREGSPMVTAVWASAGDAVEYYRPLMVSAIPRRLRREKYSLETA